MQPVKGMQYILTVVKFLTKHPIHRVSSIGKSSRIFGRISLPSSGDIIIIIYERRYGMISVFQPVLVL